METIWDLHETISRRLLTWSGLSIVAGLALLLAGDRFWRGFGIQAGLWGAIDAGIAVVGSWQSQRRRASLPDADAAQVLEREARKLRRLLWINTGLDVLYAVGGITLSLTLGAQNPNWRGHGWGIVVQGAFLFAFDLIHAQHVPVSVPSAPLLAFQDPEHQPFFWPGDRPAALLVHGFPGSPAEMRALGRSLHDAGWTVQGLLLPGFGPEIATLQEHSYEDWVAAVRETLRRLKHEHAPVVVIGYSMGAALSISVAVQDPPDGLVLLAPFWRLGSPLQRMLGAILGLFFLRSLRPLRGADLSDPQVRQAVSSFLPGADIDDPEVQEAIRQFRIPVSLLQQIDRTGQQAFQDASLLKTPTLVLQGAHDELVHRPYTRRLMERFPRSPRYIEVRSGHDLIEADQPAWSAVEEAVLSFAGSLLPPQEALKK
jgi:carboxylesterase